MADRTVLVVDDDTSIRLLCRVNLELEGNRVLEADSLAGARGVLDSESVDVVLLDVHVGTGDGLELLDELRRERPTVAVAVLTGTADVDGVRARRPDAVIGKPFALDELVDTVRRIAGRPGADV